MVSNPSNGAFAAAAECVVGAAADAATSSAARAGAGATSAFSTGASADATGGDSVSFSAGEVIAGDTLPVFFLPFFFLPAIAIVRRPPETSPTRPFVCARGGVCGQETAPRPSSGSTSGEVIFCSSTEKCRATKRPCESARRSRPVITARARAAPTSVGTRDRARAPSPVPRAPPRYCISRRAGGSGGVLDSTRRVKFVLEGAYNERADDGRVAQAQA